MKSKIINLPLGIKGVFISLFKKKRKTKKKNIKKRKTLKKKNLKK
tara:strand:+ start:3825 stop:3959 length:135 start_codon:yes stop_codon:yes gene_type:complete